MASLSPLLKQATPVHAVRGEGVYLYDADGRQYLDFTAGIGVTSTGHCHPRVVSAVQKQAGELIHGQYTTIMHPRLPELIDKLGALPAVEAPPKPPLKAVAEHDPDDDIGFDDEPVPGMDAEQARKSWERPAKEPEGLL